MAPPSDSAEAERVRIWVPIYRQSRCRLTIDILDDSDKVVRRLVDRLMGRGFHNFYWDKKDDTGAFVPPGVYKYVIKDCGHKKYGQVTAAYKEWERLSRVVPPVRPGSARFGLKLERDSAPVTILVLNRRGVVVDSAVVDSRMAAGSHEWEWRPGRRLPRGNYKAEIRVGDYAHEVQCFYAP